jgi:hypothetical protein
MGYHERTYTRVVRASNGLDFRGGGPLPRALMVGQGTEITITDQYGNQVNFGSTSSVEVTRIFDGLQVAQVKTVHSGFAFLLW